MLYICINQNNRNNERYFTKLRDEYCMARMPINGSDKIWSNLVELMNVDYRNFALFEYISTTSPKDRFRLGDLVKEIVSGEIGVIIQVHNPHEYRVDRWGNTSSSEIELATQQDISARKLCLEYLQK